MVRPDLAKGIDSRDGHARVTPVLIGRAAAPDRGHAGCSSKDNPPRRRHKSQVLCKFFPLRTGMDPWPWYFRRSAQANKIPRSRVFHHRGRETERRLDEAGHAAERVSLLEGQVLYDI